MNCPWHSPGRRICWMCSDPRPLGWGGGGGRKKGTSDGADAKQGEGVAARDRDRLLGPRQGRQGMGPSWLDARAGPLQAGKGARARARKGTPDRLASVRRVSRTGTAAIRRPSGSPTAPRMQPWRRRKPAGRRSICRRCRASWSFCRARMGRETAKRGARRRDRQRRRPGFAPPSDDGPAAPARSGPGPDPEDAPAGSPATGDQDAADPDAGQNPEWI